VQRYLKLCDVLAALHMTFKPYGLVRVEWPGKDIKGPRYPLRGKTNKTTV